LIFILLAKVTFICILYTLVPFEDLEVHQTDVKTTFLNRDLEEGAIEHKEKNL